MRCSLEQIAEFGTKDLQVIKPFLKGVDTETVQHYVNIYEKKRLNVDECLLIYKKKIA